MNQASAVKRYKKAEIHAEKRLSAAADALCELHAAAVAAGFPVKGIDDTRITLQANCREYANFLNMRIERSL